jgi:hypothetical protein
MLRFPQNPIFHDLKFFLGKSIFPTFLLFFLVFPFLFFQEHILLLNIFKLHFPGPIFDFSLKEKRLQKMKKKKKIFPAKIEGREK